MKRSHCWLSSNLAVEPCGSNIHPCGIPVINKVFGSSFDKSSRAVTDCGSEIKWNSQSTMVYRCGSGSLRGEAVDLGLYSANPAP